MVHRYPNFCGNEWPLRADKWMIGLDRTFEIYGCTKDQKVLYAIYMLQGEADR